MAADLATGIEYDLQGYGTFALSVDAATGDVVVTDRGAGGLSARAVWGLYQRIFDPPSPYADPVSVVLTEDGPIPRPEPSGRTSLALGAMRGGRIVETSLETAFGDVRAVSVAGCAYDGFDAVMAVPLVPGYSRGLLYLPALGIAVPRFTELGDEGREDAVILAIRPRG